MHKIKIWANLGHPQSGTFGLFNIMHLYSGFGRLICPYILVLFQRVQLSNSTRTNVTSINLIDIPLHIHIYLIFKQIDKYKVTHDVLREYKLTYLTVNRKVNIQNI